MPTLPQVLKNELARKSWMMKTLRRFCLLTPCPFLKTERNPDAVVETPMPTKPPTACFQCGKAGCADHKRVATKSYRPDRKFYKSARWLKFRASILIFNPMCQHLIDG